MRLKGGLGRGLDALIPSGPAATPQEVDLDDLAPNPHQPRQQDDEAALASLADSIREHGLLQPLVVTASTAGSAPYWIVAGERRWKAARLAGLGRVPVVVKETTPQQMLELALVENIQRCDLSPLEEAAAYRYLVEEFGLTQEKVAQRVGRSRVAVANTLRLLRLPQTVKESLAAGEVSEGHARALLALEREEDQLQVLGLVREKGLSVRQTEELVRRLQEAAVASPGEEAAPTPTDPQVNALENAFRQALGTKVELHRSRRGGKLVIHFYSDEELDGIYRTIVRK